MNAINLLQTLVFHFYYFLYAVSYSLIIMIENQQMKIRDSGMPEEAYWETFFNPDFIFSQLQLNSSVFDAVEFGSGYGTFTIPAAKIIKGNFYALDIEPEMIKILRQKVREEKLSNIKICGTCADARGIKNLQLIEGAQISTMAELAAWTMDSDKVLAF